MNVDDQDRSPCRADTRGLRRRWLAALVVFALALAVRIPFMAAPGFPPDQDQFFIWSMRTAKGGLAAAYDVPVGAKRSNYPPLYLYVLRALAEIYHRETGHALDDRVRVEAFHGLRTPDARTAAVVYKLPTVVADAVLGGLLVLWLWRRVRPGWAMAVGGLYSLMPGVIHDSAVWGQIDGIPTLWVVAALEMARRRRIVPMWCFAALGALTKPQGLVFVPIWLVVTALPHADRLRHIGRSAVAVGLLVVAVALPFHGSLDRVADAYSGAAGYYPYLHLNGFSAWFVANPLDRPHLDRPERFYVHDDGAACLGLSPRWLGLAAFLCVASWIVVRLWRRRCDEGSLFQAARTLPLAFFVLSTQMHERYALPVVAVWAWSFMASRRWWACWLTLGACSAINAMWAWAGPGGGPVVTAIRQVLWRPWAGLSPGVWCSAAFVVILATTLWERANGPGVSGTHEAPPS
ncbi:MAG: hypothetical protein ACE5F9_04430 [Phycisphaerae bacterium]